MDNQLSDEFFLGNPENLDETEEAFEKSEKSEEYDIPEDILDLDVTSKTPDVDSSVSLDDFLHSDDEEMEKLNAMLESRGLKRQTVDEWLDQVDYHELNNGNYVPGDFALRFLTFIKLVNGAEGEQNLTPVVHLKMLDEIAGPKERIANLCARGLAKTTLMFEYLAPYIAVFEEIEGFDEISGMIYVSDSMDNGVKSARKNLEFRYNSSEFLQRWIPKAKFTDNYIEFENTNGHRLGIKMFGAKTGLRGTKIFARRPKLAVLDDLVSDDDAKSPAAMEAIKDTVYKGINYALDPMKRKTIFNGTPFNKNDILYEAVESGGWNVNVYPICEQFPCTREEFRGAWEDRFTYDFVLTQYEEAIATGKISGFMQELMLRITSPEERLIQDEEIRWYKRKTLLQNKSSFNFYITTDFATKAKQHNDYSVISVWAYSANRDWFWVDGVCAKQRMNKSLDDLFRLASTYHPQSVGVETSGQQSAFIDWIQEQQMVRNIWFNLAKGRNKQIGIQPETDKISRFNLVVPLFKAGKIFFPVEMRKSKIMGEFVNEMTMASQTGFKSKNDDAADTISMLQYMNPWQPSESAYTRNTEEMDPFEDTLDEDDFEESDGLSSYLG